MPRTTPVGIWKLTIARFGLDGSAYTVILPPGLSRDDVIDDAAQY